VRSPGIQMLIHEHDVILKAIERVNDIFKSQDLSSNSESLVWFLEFFREYGDLYHHRKEEDILFSLIEKKDQMLATGIIKALTEHHEIFREDLGRAQNALSNNDWILARNILSSYFSNLKDHISAENDEFFISVDLLLDDSEKESLYFSFLDKDRELDENKKKEFEQKVLNEN
jgi:hemerythrin-like domain-containing protein